MLAACGLLAVLVFAAGERAGLGPAGAGFYAVALVPCLWLPRAGAPLAVAALVSALIGLGVLIAPLASWGSVTGLLGLGVTLAVVWAGALLLRRLKALEADLAGARAEAERAERSRSRFLAAAGHDLRHPLQAGLLFHELLCRRLGGSPHLDLVVNLGQSLEMMKDMLNGLLEVSRLDSGRVRPRFCDLPVQGLLDRLASRIGPMAASRGLVLTVVGSSATIRSDPDLLEPLLRNLLANAVKFTPQGRVVLGCRRWRGRLRIQVWDSGVGIPADHLRDIFEGFHQLRAIGGDAGKGLGLGLALVERLGRVLAYPVGVRSAPGRGSMFEVLVPLAGSQDSGAALSG